jgi:GT2 family glycosyltransferase
MDASLVIPTHNRRQTLLGTLEALARVEYPRDRWEIVVVDDGSEDGTSDAVEGYAKSQSLPLSCIRQAQSGPAAARNRGAREARGWALLFLDDDIHVQPSFVRDHLEALKTNRGCWTVGRVVQRPEMRHTPFGRYREILWESFNDAHPSSAASDTAGITAQNLSLPRADFERLGGFDEEVRIASCEDLLLGVQARAVGIRVLYDPRIVGVHDDWAITLERFCERQRLYSISDVLLWHRLGAASPRLAVVCVNGPLRWRHDGVALLAKKVLKAGLAARISRRLLLAVAGIVERIVPDSRLCRRLYETNVAVAIFRGVREGLRRYPIPANHPLP